MKVCIECIAQVGTEDWPTAVGEVFQVVEEDDCDNETAHEE